MCCSRRTGKLPWQVLHGDSSACWGLGRGCCARDDSLLSEMRGSFCWEMGDWRGGQFALTTAVPCCLSAYQFLGDPTFILATVTGAVRDGLWALVRGWACVYTHKYEDPCVQPRGEGSARLSMVSTTLPPSGP